ncbi:MAG: hypothetical protein J5657_05175 [Clostridiales bacterium]|jgi:hypothetical protein|nr:hypothetical protein [Clostridiales bacterium]
MKSIKIAAIMMALTMTVAGFAACSNTSGGGDDSVVVVSSESNKNNNGSETSATENTAPADEFDGWSFLYNGVNINVGTDLNIVEKTGKLGELNKDYTELKATSCAGLGLARTLTFNSGSFVINTNPDGDKDIISNISLYDDTITTAEGLYIGSSLDDVKKIYGEPDAETSNSTTYTYKKGHSILCVIIANDKVSNIVYNFVV